MSNSFIKRSRTNWSPGTPDNEVTERQIEIGCMQRIADAIEIMAKDRNNLERDLKWARESAERYQKYYEAEQRRVIALKGVITKLKNKYAPQKQKEAEL